MSWIKRKDEEHKEELVFMSEKRDALSAKYDSMIFEEEEEIVVLKKSEPSKEK